MADPGEPQTIVFFDGVCHLCNGFVDFLIQRDRRRRLRFAPLQGKTAQQELIPADRENLSTVLLLDHGHFFRRSSAVLRTLIIIGGAWMILGRLGLLIPPFLRDAAYRFIAKRRLLWFGEREFCRLPEPHERGQLME